MAYASRNKFKFMRSVFSTGQVARICQVAPRTVSKWFDSGKITGYKIPGSNDRRIPRRNLFEFMSKNGIPIPACLRIEVDALILFAGNGSEATHNMREAVDKFLATEHNVKKLFSNGAFDTAMVCYENRPNVIIVDPSFTSEATKGLLRKLVVGVPDAPLVICLLPEDGMYEEEYTELGAKVVKHPYSVEEVIQLIERVMDWDLGRMEAGLPRPAVSVSQTNGVSTLSH